MSEQACKHCWHNMGQWSDSTGTHRSEKCCHCGSFHQEDVPPPSLFPFGSGTIQQPQHGPHAPQTFSY